MVLSRMATHFLLHYGPWEDMVSAVHRILFILNSLHHGGHVDAATHGGHVDDHQVTDHRHQLDSKLASLLRIVVEDSTRFELLLSFL